MSKILETSFETGSYRNKTDNTFGVNTNGVFRRTEKGLAWKGNGSNAWVSIGPITLSRDSATIEVWAKFILSTNDNYFVGQKTVNNYSYFGPNLAGLKIVGESDTNADYWCDGNYLFKSNNFYHFMMIADGGIVKTYVNNVLVSTETPADDLTIDAIGRDLNEFIDGSVAKIVIDDEPYTAQQRAKAYERFLKASPMGIELYPKPVLPERKPTDLSRYVDTGLCLAYNMIPSAGNILVDISGNGNNGAIVGATETLEGLSFNGKDNYVGLASSVDCGINSTLCIRFNPYDISFNNQILGEKSYTSDWVIYFTATTFYFKIGAVAKSFAYVLNINHDYTLVIARTGDMAIVYLDGINVAVLTGYGTVIHTLFDTLGADENLDTFFKGTIIDFKAYSYAFNEQQAKDYHNSFVKPVLGRIPSVYDPVGSTSPFGCIKGTGNFVVDEIAIAGINNYVSDFSTDVDGWNSLVGRSSVSRVASYAGKLNVLKVTQLIDDNFLTINHATTSVWNTLSGWYKLSFCYYIPIGGDDTERLYLYDGNIILPYEDPAGKAGQWNYYEIFISTKERNFANNYIRVYRTNHVPVDDVIYFHDIKIKEISPLPELDSGAKFLRVTGAGLISVPTKQAYGTWEGMIYKGDTANRLYMILIANKIDVAGYVQGYALNFDNDEGIYLEKYDGVGGTTVLFATAASYITINTWYKYRFTRTLDGVMTLLLKGGALIPTAGYDGWTLAAPTGAYVNPTVADNTYTTCEYLVVDGGVLDRVILDHTDNGVKQ